MKKIYSKPQIDINLADLSLPLAGSVIYSKSDNAEWGAEGTYAPGVWVDEGHNTIDGATVGGFPAVSAGSEEGDWASRSNGGIWD